MVRGFEDARPRYVFFGLIRRWMWLLVSKRRRQLYRKWKEEE